MLIDTCLYSSDEAGLKALCGSFPNRIGPIQGRTAIMESTDSEGHIILAQPARGDPGIWYAAIRSNTSIMPPSGISICEKEVAQAVLGVWA